MSLAAIDARLRFLELHSIESSTERGYLTGFRDFRNFCTQHGLPINPTPQTLARYIAYTSLFISSGPKYLTGARHFLRGQHPEFDENRAHPLVQQVITGSKKVRADPVHRKQPLRTSHLQTALDFADLSHSYDDLLFATILSCCFYGCHRSGELVWKTEKSLQDWRKVIKRSSLRFSDGRVSYHLPYHKADRFFRGTTVLFSEQTVVSPTSILPRYTSARDARFGASPALFMREDGSVPTRGWFDRMLHRFVDHTFGGQSCRAGGATFYASLGLPEDIIQALGRWSSQTWKIYIRDNPTVRAEQQLAYARLRRLD
jgi:hypothetical protein